MPNIRQYEAPQGLGLQPDDRGTNAALQAARRGSAAFNEAADATTTVGNMQGRMAESAIKVAGNEVVNYMEHREVSQGSAAYAGLNDKLTQQWNDTVKRADPNDPTVAQQFREKLLEPELEKFGQSFMTEGGQKWAESRVSSLRNHMFEKTAADMGTLASDALNVNVKQTANAMSNTAMTDPSSVPHLLEGIDGTIGSMVDTSPNLKGAPAARARMQLTEHMKESIVKAGAIGAIQKAADPEAEAAKWGEKYPQFINGGDLKALSANARQQIRAARMDAAYQDRQRDNQTQDASDKRVDEYMKNLYSDDPQQATSISARGIVNDPKLTRRDKDYMLARVDRVMKPETAAQVSAESTVNLLTRLQAPEGAPDRITDIQPIYDAFKKGDLTRTDTDWLVKQFRESRSPEGEKLTSRKSAFMEAVKPTIDKSNPLMGSIDKDGKLNSYRLMVDLDTKIAEYRKTGKNPFDLLDPAKPDYMGRPEALQPYQKPLQQSIRDQASRLTTGGNLTGPGKTITGVEVVPSASSPAISPRKPGESPAAYLKRTGS